jgi:predicted Zn-dependent protease
MSSPRAEQLRKLLEKTPGDTFLLYALALELKKLDDKAGALDYLARTITIDPHYHYAYYQQGQILESQGETEAAKAAYDAGIARAGKVGDGKALGELNAARDLLD